MLARHHSSVTQPSGSKQPSWLQGWEDMARLDPYWAILSDPAKRHGRWNRTEFFDTGRAQIERFLEQARGLGLPNEMGSALDFGCGVGRLTQALARHFHSATGVDISPTMIDTARSLADGLENCHFAVSMDDSLSIFDDEQFDLVYSHLVLQHLASVGLIARYIVAFVRVLRPGGLLVFQVPGPLPIRRQIQAKARIYALLRGLGVSSAFAYRLGLHPIRMRGIKPERVVDLATRSGAKVLRVDRTRGSFTNLIDHVYYLSK